jgi:hypothetical protein
VPLAAVAEGHEPRRERGAGEARAPQPHGDGRAALREADVQEAVVEVAAVGRVDRTVVLQAPGDHERGVHDRHGQDEQRQQEDDGRSGLEQALDGHRREDEAQAEGAGVAHEDPGREEVVAQEPEARAGHDRRQDRGVRLSQREREDRVRDACDSADARGEAVHPVEEVDHVHHRDDEDHRERDADPRRDVEDAEERERDVVDPDAERTRDRRGDELPEELHRRRQAAEVVDGSDDGRDGRPEEDAPALGREVEERERGHQDAQEDRKAAESRNRTPVDPSCVRPVDRPEHPRHPADRGRQEDDDDERDDRPIEDLRRRAQLVEH